MATWRPKTRVCTLNFDGKYTYTLPLHEDTAYILDDAFAKLKNLAPKDRAGVDETYNAALDELDRLLGEGAADNIMSLCEKPGTLDVIDVMNYIVDEWKEQFTASVDTPVPNRAERRARR